MALHSLLVPVVFSFLFHMSFPIPLNLILCTLVNISAFNLYGTCHRCYSNTIRKYFKCQAMFFNYFRWFALSPFVVWSLGIVCIYIKHFSGSLKSICLVISFDCSFKAIIYPSCYMTSCYDCSYIVVLKH